MNSRHKSTLSWVMKFNEIVLVAPVKYGRRAKNACLPHESMAMAYGRIFRTQMQLQPNRVAEPAGGRSSTSTVSASEPQQNPCVCIYILYIRATHNTHLRSPILTINPLASLTSILGLRIAGSCTTDFPRFVRAYICNKSRTRDPRTADIESISFAIFNRLGWSNRSGIVRSETTHLTTQAGITLNVRNGSFQLRIRSFILRARLWYLTIRFMPLGLRLPQGLRWQKHPAWHPIFASDDTNYVLHIEVSEFLLNMTANGSKKVDKRLS